MSAPNHIATKSRKRDSREHIGGKALTQAPNFAALNRRVSGAKWPGLRYPDHVNYFTPTTLRAAVHKAGLQFELVNRHKIWLDDNIQALAIKPA